MKILITGGAGFIGSALVRQFINETGAQVVNVDSLTYAGNLDNIADVAGSSRYAFEKVDVCDAAALGEVFAQHRPDAVVHLAAESHVDRSIDGPRTSIETNLLGTFTLLEAARAHWQELTGEARAKFRFHHVSTDEVFGSLGGSLGADGAFSETSPYRPNSPYAASKAGADHLVRAWHETYGLPVVLSNCSNNYGPFQYPEKLIPLLITKALVGEPMPIYGTGSNVRDWLYVEDHATALRLVLEQGRVGESYNIGGNEERTNLQVADALCGILDELLPGSPHRPYANLISFVADRPGHDLRYAIDAGKVSAELGWRPRETFATGLRKTVEWYFANQDWCARAESGAGAGERLGLGTARVGS